MHFVLIYFEQIDEHGLKAQYQLEDSDEPGHYEDHLELYRDEVHRLLTRELHWGLGAWLFHHYGSVLAAEDWRNHPGEIWGFARMICFAVPDVRLDARVQTFAESFGLRLLGDEEDSDHQLLGIELLWAIMRYTYQSDDYTDIAQDILPLLLNRLQQANDESDEHVYDLVYYCIRSIRVPDHPLLDAVLSIVEDLMHQEVPGLCMNSINIELLIRILLLELPEVEMDEKDSEAFYIQGQKCNLYQLWVHLMHWFGAYHGLPFEHRRIAISRKLRIAEMLPAIVRRIVSYSYESSYADPLLVRGLNALTMLVFLPFGTTIRQRSARATLLSDMTGEMIITLKAELVFIKHPRGWATFRKSFREGGYRLLHQDLLRLHFTIRDGIDALVHEVIVNPDLQPELLRRLRSYDQMRIGFVHKELLKIVNVCDRYREAKQKRW